MNYNWPGNIRELENLMERALILETSTVLSPESFPKILFEEYGSVAAILLDEGLPIAEAKRRAVALPIDFPSLCHFFPSSFHQELFIPKIEMIGTESSVSGDFRTLNAVP